MKKLILLIIILFLSIPAWASTSNNGANVLYSSGTTNLSALTGNTLSIGGWFNYSNVTTTAARAFEFEAEVDNDDQIFNVGLQDCSIFGGASGKVCISLGMDNSGLNVYGAVYIATTLPTSGGKHHIMITWNNTSGTVTTDFKFYVDGTLTGTPTATFVGGSYSNSFVLSSERSATAIFLGAGSDGYTPHDYYTGTMSDLAVWNKALTSGEVTTLYNGGTNSPCTHIPASIEASSLVAYFPLDDYPSGTISTNIIQNSGNYSFNINTNVGSVAWSTDMNCASGGTTWYVRPSGGTPTQCTGKTNADYPGSGSGQACAFANPMYALGAGCGNFGFSCTVSGVMSSGDTLDIDGDNGSNQAQYPIGYDSTGVITPSNSGNCTSGGALNCTMGNMPDGSTVQTTPGSTHQAQLWGREHLNQVINDNISSSFTIINNLEITQHSACVYNGADPNHTTDGFPNRCVTSSAPFGPWAIGGISLTGSGITLENNWIHGMGQWGVTTGSITNLIEEGNTINGNGGGGFGIGQNNSGGTITFGGINTINNEKIVFNGCGSHYPLHSSDPYDTLNYHTCADDGSSNGTMLADGWACEAGSCDTSGTTVNMSNTDVSFNTKGGIDNLHADGLGTFNAYRVRAEGNESQQLKLNYNAVNIENSQLINDCNYFEGQSFNTTIDGCGNTLPHFYPVNTCMGNSQAYTASWDFCRAAGNTIRLAIGAPETVKISNSTLYSNGGANVEYSGACTASPTVAMNNNIVVNAPDYTSSGQNTSFWEDDTTSGPCVTTTEDYNLNYQPHTSQCAGAHDICTNPSNAAVTGNFALNGNSGTSYTLTGLATQFYPSSGGVLVGAANNALSLTGTSNDYNVVARSPSTYTIGGYTQGSCVASGGTCFESGECCSGACSSLNLCTSSCSGNGVSCSTGAQCCSSLCQSSLCVSCLSNSQTCSTGAQCCSGICNASICTPPPSGGYEQDLIGGECKLGGQVKL